MANIDTILLDISGAARNEKTHRLTLTRLYDMYRAAGEVDRAVPLGSAPLRAALVNIAAKAVAWMEELER